MTEFSGGRGCNIIESKGGPSSKIFAFKFSLKKSFKEKGGRKGMVIV